MKLPMLQIAVLLTAAVIPVVAGNIVANPGFESGLTGWTAQNWGSGNFAVHSGSLEAYTTCAGAPCISVPTAFLYQDLATVAAQTYALTFWYRFQGPSTGGVNELQTLAGGVIVSDLVNQGNNGGIYQQVLTTFVATGSITRLQFNGRNDPSFLIIDDVCADVNGGSCGLVATTPEPSTGLLSGLSLLGFGFLLPRIKRSRSPEPDRCRPCA